MLGEICFYGFLIRWNDSMTTELEDAPKNSVTQYQQVVAGTVVNTLSKWFNLCTS